MAEDSISVDTQGNKTDPLGRDIDNFLRNIFGGEDVDGKTTSMGVLPQAPTLGSAASGVRTGIQAVPVSVSPLEPFGGAGPDKIPAPVPAPVPVSVPIPAGSTVNGPGEFEPDAIGADVFEDPNSMNPFGDRFADPEMAPSEPEAPEASRQPDLSSMIELNSGGDPFTELDNPVSLTPAPVVVPSAQVPTPKISQANSTSTDPNQIPDVSSPTAANPVRTLQQFVNNSTTFPPGRSAPSTEASRIPPVNNELDTGVPQLNALLNMIFNRQYQQQTEAPVKPNSDLNDIYSSAGG